MSLPFRRNLSEAAQLARRQWDSASVVGASHLTSSRLTSAGCNPFSVFFVSFLFWLCVFGLSVCCFCFLFMPCFSGFVLFSCWDCFWTAYWSTTGTFVAFNKWTALHLFFSSQQDAEVPKKVQDKRLGIELAALRESLSTGNGQRTSQEFMPQRGRTDLDETSKMLADALTTREVPTPSPKFISI